MTVGPQARVRLSRTATLSRTRRSGETPGFAPEGKRLDQFVTETLIARLSGRFQRVRTACAVWTFEMGIGVKTKLLIAAMSAGLFGLASAGAAAADTITFSQFGVMNDTPVT